MKVTNYTPAIDPRDLGDREELIAPDKTDLNVAVRDDTIADPEGAAARQDAVDNPEFPEWALRDYKPSSLDYWSKEWPDGQMHLIPTEATVEAVVTAYREGMEADNLAGMVDFGTSDPDHKVMDDAYQSMISGCSKPKVFGLVSGIGNACESALAERAYRRYLFESQASKADLSGDLPEYLEKYQEAMMNSSREAGTWYLLHTMAWEKAGWKNQPNYTSDATVKRVRNQIVFKLIRSAAYIDENHRTVKGSRLTGKETLAFTIKC